MKEINCLPKRITISAKMHNHKMERSSTLVITLFWLKGFDLGPQKI
jgi:hypothetical protein